MDRRIETEEAVAGTAGRRMFLGRAAVGGIAAAAALVPIVGAAAPASASATTQPSPGPVYAADSIARLRQVNSSRYTAVTVAGYYAPGDRGGGTYHYDPADHHTADNGGTVIVGSGGARWKLAYAGPLSLRQFGAKGDGVTDDTAAIRRWLAALPEGGAGYAAVGKYRFTQPLVAPVRNRIAITGDGSQQTVFVYGGTSKTIDLLTIGDGTTSLSGWSLEGFSINSTTTMTAGTALRIKKLQNGNRVTDISFSALNAPKKLWDGIWFDSVNVLTYDHFEIDVQNEGLIVNGVAGADAGSDLTLDKGTITFPKIGIHVAGGFGGLYVGQVLVYGALVDGYLQDNGRVARGNRELVLSDFLVLDAAHANTLHINDPLSQNSVVQISAFISGAGWIAPASPGDGIFIESLPGGRVSIDSAQIKSSVRHGIRIADSTTLVRIASTTFITDSGGWGIFADVPTPNVAFAGAAIYNGLGALSPNLSPDAVPTISGTQRNDYTGDLGMRFTTGADPVAVTKLGRWIIAGSSDSHTLKILDSTTLATVASAVIDASGGSVGFRYAAASATLAPNTTYFLVSSETTGGDKWYHSSTMVTPGPIGRVDYAVYSTGSGFAADSSQQNTSFVPPNFLYSGASGELPFLLNS